MKLLTQKIKKQLPPMLTTEDIPCREKTFVCKFFNPMGPQTWYVCEGAPTGVPIERDIHFENERACEYMEEEPIFSCSIMSPL